MDIKLKINRTQGFLPGTCGWLTEQLKERNCELYVSTTKGNKPACFLRYDTKEEGSVIKRKSMALAIYNYWDGYNKNNSVETYPFPDDFSDFYVFDGVKLTDAASSILADIANNAKNVLELSMSDDDKAAA